MYVCKLWDLSYVVNKYDDFSCFYKRKVEIKRAGQLAMDKKIGSWLHILSKKENQWSSATELVWHARYTYLTLKKFIWKNWHERPWKCVCEC